VCLQESISQQHEAQQKARQEASLQRERELALQLSTVRQRRQISTASTTLNTQHHDDDHHDAIGFDDDTIAITVPIPVVA
jgi:hypothetical protein